MHLPDGLLSAPVCLGGYGLTGLATWYCLRQIQRDPDVSRNMPKASLLTAAFFVASSIHIPIPPTSVHLVLNGLLGTVLGYYAFPAILIGLLFQAVILGHGGMTVLGVNAVMMGVPALVAYQAFQLRRFWRWGSDRSRLGIFAFLAGALGLGLAALIFFVLVMTNIPAAMDAQAERTAIYGLTLAHIPLMLIEGGFTAMLVLFLHQVKPDLLGHHGTP
ncbi:MAG TPA: cobalt transporter CbiM [Candidatus Obscuribacterales bacterium]